MPGTARTAFDWDEAEQVLSGASLPIETEERSSEEKHNELGETATGRLLVVACTWRRALWRSIKKGHDA